MPFSCIAKILPGQLREGQIVFDAWIHHALSQSYVEQGTAFARAHDSVGPCVLRLNGPGNLSKNTDLKPGDVIREGDVVVLFMADGEAIPYGKPFCLVEYI